MSREPRIFTFSPQMRGHLQKAVDAHKYEHGHAVVVTGGAGRTGAARLAGAGALRVGAGLVTLAVPDNAAAEVASQITAIMMSPLAGISDLDGLLDDPRLTALCIGPGLGLEPRQVDMVAAVLARARPTVLDADALTLIASHPALMAALHPTCVLTPHEGEFARLFPDLANNLPECTTISERAVVLRAAAARVGCCVMLKGPATLVADPHGQSWAHLHAEDGALSWLATAGSGDVLAGFCAGLLARRLPVMLATNLAVYLHRSAAMHFGPGLIAEDLPEVLPALFREMGL
jgi:ADP-dependent NAD(P)H-hydrate dehydratase / NAD(P)H-hydrate epimerase